MKKIIILSSLLSATVAFVVGWQLGTVNVKDIHDETKNEASNMSENTLIPENDVKRPPKPEGIPSNFVPLTRIDIQTGIEGDVTDDKDLTLEKAIEQRNRLAMQNAALQMTLNNAQMMLAQQGKALDTISIKEAEELLPMPFSDAVANSSGQLVKKFKEMHSEKEDVEWALQMQQRITDFYFTHELSNEINLQSVKCKQTICEIRGFQQDENINEQIMNQMLRQPWWELQNIVGTSSSMNEGAKYFYTIASRDG